MAHQAGALAEGSLPKRVFIIGSGQSGTTLLFELLSRHPEIFRARRESKFFQYRDLVARAYPDLNDDATSVELIRYLSGVLADRYVPPQRGTLPSSTSLSASEARAVLLRAVPRTYGGLFACTLDHLARRDGKSLWVEKTPAHIFEIERIVEEVAGAHFLEIVRDPRDVLGSRKRRRLLVQSSHYPVDLRRAKALQTAYDPLWDALSWRAGSGAARGAAARHPGVVLSLHYEALVGDPLPALTEVCRFLQVDFCSGMLRSAWRSEGGHVQMASGIDTRSVGRWRRELTGAEVAVVQSVTGRHMTFHGYRREPVPPRDVLGAIALGVRSPLELFWRLCARARLGGLRWAVMMARGYLKRLRTVR